YETFRAKDGYLNVAVGNDSLYEKLAALLEDPALQEPRFAKNADRVRQRDALFALLAPHFASRPVAEWVQKLSEAGIPAGPISDVGEALEHPQAKAREMVVKTEHPKA